MSTKYLCQASHYMANATNTYGQQSLNANPHGQQSLNAKKRFSKEPRSSDPTGSTISTVSTAPSSLDGSLTQHAEEGGVTSGSERGVSEYPQDAEYYKTLSEEQWKLLAPLQVFRRYAYSPEDMQMLRLFAELIEIDPEIAEDGDFVKPVLRCMKLLHLCDYSPEEICCMLAHASCYLADAYALCGGQMDATELGHVIVSLLFIAHSYTQDETCPLQVWHQHLCRRYCSVRTLNAAIFRLLEIRGFVLRVEEEELQKRFRFLNGGTGFEMQKGGEPEVRMITVKDAESVESESARVPVSATGGVDPEPPAWPSIPTAWYQGITGKVEKKGV